MDRTNRKVALNVVIQIHGRGKWIEVPIRAKRNGHPEM
jgi:hypothetical protein